MTFFNKKEEVVELKLTRVGREKLSQGKFAPTHYEFLDEDVLYDKYNYISGSYEEQNEIKKRIKENISLRYPTAKQGAISSKGTKSIENKLIESLGTFIPYSNLKPAWDLKAIDGTIFTGSGEIEYTSLEARREGSVNPSYEKIPQLDLVCDYNYNIFILFDKNNTKKNKDFYAAVDENPFITINDLLKEDDFDAFMLFKKGFNDFTMTVEEDNVLKEREMFTLEVYEYKYSNEFQKIELEKLYFDSEDIDETSVQWYFDISTDGAVEPAREGFTFVNEKVEVEGPDDECEDV
jgi:hypothetical protein